MSNKTSAVNATRRARVPALMAALGAVLTGCSLPFAGGSSQPASVSAVPATVSALVAGPQKEIGKWNGTYTDATVTVGGENGLGAVRSLSADGRIFVIDNGASGVARLKAGSIMLLTGVAVRKVVDVQPSDQGLVVTTDSAQITDLIKGGGFDFNAAVDMSRGSVMRSVTPDDCALRYGLPSAIGVDSPEQLTACNAPGAVGAGSSTTDSRTSSTDSRTSSTESGTSSTSSGTSSTGSGTSSTGSGTSSTSSGTSSTDSLVGIAPVNRFFAAGGVPPSATAGQEGTDHGVFGPWKWSANFTPQNGGVGLKLVVAGKEGDGEAALTASGFMTNFNITGKVGVTACKPSFALSASGLQGTSDIAWTAALSKGVLASNHHWHPGVAWSVPIGRVGPFPLAIKIGTGVLMQPALSGEGGGKGSYHADFSGTIGFDVAAGGKPSVHSGLTMTPSTPGSDIRTVGVSGLVTAVQFPNVALSLGSPQSSLPLAFTDVVLSGGASYSGATNGLMQCWQDDVHANNGIGLSTVTNGAPTLLGSKTELSHQGIFKKQC